MDLSRSKRLPAELRYIQYEHELEAQYLPAIRSLISKDLSEPYSIYVYRYFLCQWAHLCFMVRFGPYGGCFGSDRCAASSLLTCRFPGSSPI